MSNVMDITKSPAYHRHVVTVDWSEIQKPLDELQTKFGLEERSVVDRIGYSSLREMRAKGKGRLTVMWAVYGLLLDLYESERKHMAAPPIEQSGSGISIDPLTIDELRYILLSCPLQGEICNKLALMLAHETVLAAQQARKDA